MELVILAAGMGSRFGGLKQVEPVGPNGEFILDYSIYDAIKAGFDKVVFIIKKENYELFRETIGKRIEKKIKVDYVFQEMKDIPQNVTIPEGRVKPWGTAHAIYCCRNKVHDNFAVINADDFYGFEPFNLVKKYFDNSNNDNNYCLLGYQLINSLSENGKVKRGLCEKNIHNNLISLKECEMGFNAENKLEAIDLVTSEKYNITATDEVSMNFWGFRPNLFKYLDSTTVDFFERNKKNLDKVEYLLPVVLGNLVGDNKVNVDVLTTTAKCYGITYKEDKSSLVQAISKMIDDGMYPKNLWN